MDLFGNDRLQEVVRFLKTDGPGTARAVALGLHLKDDEARAFLAEAQRLGLVRCKNRSDETRAYDARTGRDRPRSAVIWWAAYD